MHLHMKAISEITLEHIPYKRQINANGVTTLQLQSQILPNMCSPTVESAGAHNFRQEI